MTTGFELGKLTVEEAPLIAMLDEQDRPTQWKAADALGKIGEPAIRSAAIH